MQQSRTLYVGLDVHKDSIAVAEVAQDHGAEVVSLGNIGTRQGDSDQRLRRLQSQSPHLVFVYEAGPGGSWLYRSLPKKGPGCGVVAPSWIPNKPGERVQTTRRDALTLARLLRAGDLTPGSVPTVEDAASRDLCRARAAALHALQAAQLRLQALRLRQALRDTGRAPWGPAPLRWLRAVVCPPPAPQLVCPEDVRAVTEQTERLARLAQARKDQVQTWRRVPVVEALQALRGVQGTVAVTTVAARGDLTRCEHPRQLLHSLGVTPSDYSTGERRRQGSITKAGHPQARRALLEGAWASRSPAKGSRPLQLRREQVPKPIQDSRWKAQGRLCKRSRQLLARGKNAHPVVGAIARARRALRWAIAPEVPLTP